MGGKARFLCSEVSETLDVLAVWVAVALSMKITSISSHLLAIVDPYRSNHLKNGRNELL